MKQRPKETVSPPEIQPVAMDHEDEIEGDSAVSTRKALTHKSTHLHRQMHVSRSRTPERRDCPDGVQEEPGRS